MDRRVSKPEEKAIFTGEQTPEVAEVREFCFGVAESLGVPYESQNYGRVDLTKLRDVLNQYLGVEKSQEIIDFISEENLLFLKNDPASKRYAKLSSDEKKVNVMLSLRSSMRAIAAHRVIHTLWEKFSSDAKNSDPEVDFEIEFFQSAVKAFSGVEIHPGAKIGRRFLLDHGTGFILGETGEIGDDCDLYHGSTIGASGAGSAENRHPKIGKGFKAGNGVKLLGPMKIGDNVEIGTGATVINSPIGSNSSIAPEIRVIGVIIPEDTRVVDHIKGNEYLIRNYDHENKRWGAERVVVLESSGIKRSRAANIAEISADTVFDVAGVVRGGVEEVVVVGGDKI